MLADTFVLAGTLFLALWAGMLALSEESVAIQRLVSDEKGDQSEEPLRQSSIYVARVFLIVLSGFGAGFQVFWWNRSFGWALVTIAVSVTFLYMVCEALPRTLGSAAPELAEATRRIADRSVTLFSPFARLAKVGERSFLKLVPNRAAKDESDAIAQRDLVYGIHSLADSTVEEIMTPRLDIEALDEMVSWSDVVESVKRVGHARFPIYKETLDHITGILYAKDLVPAVAGVAPIPARWQDLVRPVEFVPESKSLAEQLRDFQRGPAHLAVVVDEFGGTAGLVTLEDILEEVVGEIHDEYDEEEQPPIVREGDDKFWVDGGLPLDELSTLLEKNLEKEDINTVGGLIYSELGRVPNPGDEFSLGGYRVVVERVVRRRVRRVYFERLQGNIDVSDAGVGE
ncbi:MAG: hemolysin family protein [Gemmatimonadota bacterium]|nr:hemolysin family protein [Gemmatimonadota bacterium]MDH5804635.1 hemolysin family protein [Gemmatimonadota bacterium]